MPLSQYQTQLESAANGNEITQDHFGANSVGTANFAVDGGPFDQAITALGVTHLRYPGGTLTEEQLDPKTGIWEQLLTSEDTYITLPDGQRIQTLHSMLDFAGDNGLTVNLVLPTAFLLSEGESGFRLPDSDAIDTMVQQLGSALRDNPNSANIGTIEIGNEYYYQGRMTANEYGTLADEVSLKLDAELNRIEAELNSITGFEAPDIAVQSGAGWQPGDNEIILEMLSTEAKDVIDAVVLHYYPRTLDGVDRYGRHFSELDDWRDDPQLSDIKSYVSEWNIQNTDASDNGMLHASSLVAAFEELLLQGVDVASIWGTQYRSMDTRLSTLSSRDTGDERAFRIDTDLTAAGEVFSIMQSSLIGLRPLDIDTSSYMTSSTDSENEEEANIHVTDFGSNDRYVSFISNRGVDAAARLNLQLASFFGNNAHLSIRIIQASDDPATANADESDPGDARAEPDVDFVFTGPIEDAPQEIIIPEGAIVILDVNFDSSGILLEGQDPISSESFIDYADALTGSSGNDTILGHDGEDTLNGSAGRDILYGGHGNDFVYGGDHSDLIHGGHGDDLIQGGSGHDILNGSLGNDEVFGDAGNDLLLNESGQSSLFGGSGNDSFLITGGQTTVVGGDGADYLRLIDSENVTFSDFDIEEGDRIDVSSYYQDDQSLQAALSEAVSSAREDGLVTLNLGDSGSISFFHQGKGIEDLSGAFVTDLENGDFIERTAEVINQLTMDQSSAFASSLPTDMLEILTGEDQVGEFFDALSPQATTGFLLGLSPEELLSIGERLGDGAFFEMLTELNDANLLQFASSVSSDQLQEILSGVPSESIESWFATLPFSVQTAFGDAVHGTLLPRPDIDHISSDDDETTEIEEDDETSLDDDDPVDLPVDQGDDGAPEPDEDANSPEASGDCYIATVAFAGMNHPAVWMLRWYRDMVLRKSKAGRLAVSLYWYVGPILARRFAKRRTLRFASRITCLLVAKLIAWYFGRAMGRQHDHSLWPENRKLVFKLGSTMRIGSWWPWK